MAAALLRFQGTGYLAFLLWEPIPISGDASMAGIYIPGTNQVTLSNNKIWNLNSASSGCVAGISINSNASGTINGNNIYNLTNARHLNLLYHGP